MKLAKHYLFYLCIIYASQHLEERPPFLLPRSVPSLFVCEAQRTCYPITCPDVHPARFADIKVINNEGQGSVNSRAAARNSEQRETTEICLHT